MHRWENGLYCNPKSAYFFLFTMWLWSYYLSIPRIVSSSFHQLHFMFFPCFTLYSTLVPFLSRASGQPITEDTKSRQIWNHFPFSWKSNNSPVSQVWKFPRTSLFPGPGDPPSLGLENFPSLLSIYLYSYEVPDLKCSHSTLTLLVSSPTPYCLSL